MIPSHAMILAAGLGKRMSTDPHAPPKPLREIAGKPLVLHMADRLAAVGVQKIIVNVHHKADQVINCLAQWQGAEIIISDETDKLLETGGGVRKALPLLGDMPFFVCNADILWRSGDGGGDMDLHNLAARFDPTLMDACLLLSPKAKAVGYDENGDFDCTEDGQLSFHKGGDYAYAGVQIMQPQLLAAHPAPVFSLRDCFQTAAKAGTLYGHVMQGQWLHVGTPEGLERAEAIIMNVKNR